MTVADVDERCHRCLRPTPRDDMALHGNGRVYGTVCRDCADINGLVFSVAARYADYRIRCAGALALLRLGCPRAAAAVLDGQPWPRLDEARDMQRRVA